MKVLVTGGAGFIGSHTVDRLLEEGYEIRIVDNLSKPVHLKGKPKYIPAEAEFIEADVRDKDKMAKVLKGIDAAYHLAAYQDYLTDFSKFFSVNSVGTALLYELIVEKNLPITKVVVASSQSVYGEGKYKCLEHGDFYPNTRLAEDLDEGRWDCTCPICGGVMQPQATNESKVNPQNQYAVSKYSQELIALNLGKRYGIPTTAIRYSIVQGPRQSFYNAYSGALRIFCLSLYFDRAPTIFEDGNQLRDYVNIEDVVKANLLLLKNPKTDYQVFNLGGGKAHTVKEFFEVVRKVFEKDIEPIVDNHYRYGDTRHIVSDIGKLKSLGWEPVNSVEKSVRDYRDWLMNQDCCEDILDYAENDMKALGVIRTGKS